jgi:hypothetical protein
MAHPKLPPVQIVASGGKPMTQVAATGGKAPAAVVNTGSGPSITLTTNAPPVILYDTDGVEYEPEE